MIKRSEDLPLVKNGRVMNAQESAKILAESFYPEDSESGDNEVHRHVREAAKRVNDGIHDEFHDPAFTLEELKTTVDSFNPKKAPPSSSHHDEPRSLPCAG